MRAESVQQRGREHGSPLCRPQTRFDTRPTPAKAQVGTVRPLMRRPGDPRPSPAVYRLAVGIAPSAAISS
jgi:hypothetical protein